MGPAEAAPLPPVRVEVVFSPGPGRVERRPLTLPAGATVADAVAGSGFVLAADAKVGVWGRLRPLDDVLREHDRVEIYRALTVDPKEARRQRYRSQRGAKATKATP